jgi:diacylglycerol kinase family enzyme
MTFIIVNPLASGGEALQKWQRIEGKVYERLRAATQLVMNRNTNLKELVGNKLREDVTEFVAAGGDGTVNSLLCAIMECASSDILPRVKIGAIGLGSSNDFHKPFRAGKYINGIPCKIDFDSSSRRDVGLVEFEGDKGSTHTRYWLVNASIGITAEANLFFNRPNDMLRFLKRRFTGGAILYAALGTIARYRNKKMQIRIDRREQIQTDVTNLGVVKSPHFSGNFCYDSPYRPDSGYFDVHLCERMTRPRTLVTLWKLSQAKFSGLPRTQSWVSTDIALRADKPFALEFDGEVVETCHATFSLNHKSLQVCT